MSVKNLRKNTQLINYFKKLYKQTKKIDTTYNFAVAKPSSVIHLVKQPCLNSKKDLVFDMVKKCAPGWTSIDERTKKRINVCTRKSGASAPLPMCEKKSYNDKLKKHKIPAPIDSQDINLQDLSDNIKTRLEKSLQYLTKKYQATRTGRKLTEEEARVLASLSPKKRNIAVALGSKRFIDDLKKPLYSSKGITQDHIKIFDRFFEIYDKAKDVMAGKLTKIPYPKVNPQNPKSRIIEEMVFDDMDRISYVLHILSSKKDKKFLGFFWELERSLKLILLKTIIDDRIRLSKQSQPKEFFSDGYCTFTGLGQRNIFHMDGETKFLRGDSAIDPKTKEVIKKSLKDKGAPLENFGHAPSQFTKHLISNPEYTKKMDESLYKLAKETYIYTDNPADLYKSRGKEGEPNYRAIGSSTQAGLKKLLEIVNTKGMESTLVPKFEKVIEDLDKFFNLVDRPISSLNAKQRKALSRRFNTNMNNLYSTIHEIAEEEISSTHKRTYFGIHTYTTYFAEFHTAVDAILSEDSEGVLVPTATNYPLGDVHKVVRSNGQTGHEMRITFVSTKNGFGSNDSSLSAIAAVKFLGENSYYRNNPMSQKVRTIKVKDPQKIRFNPETTLEEVLANFDNLFDFKLLTAGDENKYLLPRPKTTSMITDPTTGQQVEQVDSWNNNGVGADIVLRTSKNDSLFVRPGTKLSLEEFYDTLLEMRKEIMNDNPNPNRLEILASKLIEADGKNISKLDTLKNIIKKVRFKNKPDTFNHLKAFLDDVFKADASNDSIDTVKYFKYPDFSVILANANKEDFQDEVSSIIREKVNKILEDSLMHNNIGARKIQNAWKSQFYELFPTIAYMPDKDRNTLLNSIFPPISESEETQWFGQNKTVAEKRNAASTLNTRYMQNLRDYLGSDQVYDKLHKGAKVYEVFEGVSATNLKYQYSNAYEERTQEMLNAFPVDPKTGVAPKIEDVASDPRVQRYLKDLNSGLNLQDKTILPALKETYEKFLNKLTFPELDTLIKIQNIASGTSKKVPTPLGTTGARVLQVLASNLGLFEGDEQFLVLSNKIKSKDVKDESRTKDIEKHFRVCYMESEIKPNGLVNKLKQETPLNLSKGQLVKYMKNDFKLDDHSAGRFLKYIGKSGKKISELNNQELLENLQKYIDKISNTAGSVLTLKTNLDPSSTVTKYNNGKENVGNYAALGLKASPYGMAAYFAYNQGDTLREQKSIYHATMNFLNNLAKKARDALEEVLRTSPKAKNFKEAKSLSKLKNYYLRLLRKRT